LILIKPNKGRWGVYVNRGNKVDLIANADAVTLTKARVSGLNIVGEPHSAYGINYLDADDDLMRKLALYPGKYMPGWLQSKIFIEGDSYVVGRKFVAECKLVTVWGDHVAMSGIKFAERSSALHTGSAFTGRRA
jgi:hypothetical protein